MHRGKKKFFLFLLMMMSLFFIISCGSSGSAPDSNSGSSSDATGNDSTVSSKVGSVDVMISQTVLPADGSSQAQVIATVKTVDNQAVSDAEVIFKTTGGVITSPHTTDENGQAIAFITSDRWNREGSSNKVVVTATSQGISGSATMAFTGVSIEMEPQPSSLLTFVESDPLTDHPLSKISFVLTDGADLPIADEVISVTANRGIFTDSGANQLTDSTSSNPSVDVTTSATGEAVLYLKSVSSGTSTITATARNTKAETSIVFSAYDLRFADLDGLSDVITLSETQPLKFELLKNGVGQPGQVVNFSTTLGTLTSYRETTDSSGEVGTTLTPGTQSGIAVVDATTTPDFQENMVLKVQTKVVTIADTANKIVLSKDPGVIDVTNGVSTIQAEVYDVNDNPVPFQNVYFRIVNGPSGGEYLSESVKETNSSGVAEIQFYAGALTSDSVEIKASLKPDFTGTESLISLTIAGPVANISVGMNLEKVVAASAEDGFLEVGVSAIVTDINGNSVADNTPVIFTVQSIAFDEDRDSDNTIACRRLDGTEVSCDAPGLDPDTNQPLSSSNLGTLWFSDDVNQDGKLDMAGTEDINGNQILDSGEDINGNGVIDPVQGVTIATPILTEDGVASSTMKYPMPYADNIKVRITAQAGGKWNFYERTLLCTTTMIDNGTCGGGY